MREILQLLFPLTCLLCSGYSSGADVCGSCYLKIAPTIRYRNSGGIGYWAGADYGDALAQIILLAKEENNSSARNFLAELVVQSFMAASQQFDTRDSLLIPIPSSKAANRTRGFRHAFLLARAAATKIDKSALGNIEVRELLKVNRRIADQSNLNKGERIKNLSGAYSIVNQKTANRKIEGESAFKGRSIFLIDDLVTTGSSTREGLRAFHAAGFTAHGVLSAGVSPRVFS